MEIGEGETVRIPRPIPIRHPMRKPEPRPVPMEPIRIPERVPVKRGSMGDFSSTLNHLGMSLEEIPATCPQCGKTLVNPGDDINLVCPDHGLVFTLER